MGDYWGFNLAFEASAWELVLLAAGFWDTGKITLLFQMVWK